MTLKRKAYLLNLLFLFYITLGPTKALCYHFFSPSNTALLYHLQTITKTRLSKKLITETNKSYKKDIKIKDEKDEQDITYYLVPDFSFQWIDILSFIENPVPRLPISFKRIPLHLFYCVFRC